MPKCGGGFALYRPLETLSSLPPIYRLPLSRCDTTFSMGSYVDYSTFWQFLDKGRADSPKIHTDTIPLFKIKNKGDARSCHARIVVVCILVYLLKGLLYVTAAFGFVNSFVK